MSAETGIKWTDSTSNPWWGCTKVEGALACIDCYAEEVDKRGTASDQPLHWGHGAPRRRISEKTRNEPLRWNANADRWFAAYGRRQRVFTLSMGDLFDKEVDDTWRAEHMAMMAQCDKLEWQICTKRIPQLPKMVPTEWGRYRNVTFKDGVHGETGPAQFGWPQNIGVLITVVTQAEADRDIPRLLSIKKDFGIPWVGISYEPAAELIDFSAWLRPPGLGLDWIIFGGKSGGNWNDQPFDINWARKTRDACAVFDTPFFMKQVAAFRPQDSMIPADLMVRQWPKGH